MTIQRGGGPTPASVFEDDSINQVGGDIIREGNSEQIAFAPIDTEFLFSLANFKKYSGRVKRSVDSIDIIYPSDSPITDPPDPANSFLVSNDVSYVFPQTYNPTRASRQTLPSQVPVLTTSSGLANPTSPSLGTNPSFTSSYPTVTPPAPLASQHTTQTDEDYDDWGVVVSVVKSMSESDSSITIIQQHETTPTFEDDLETTTPTPIEETTIMTNVHQNNSSTFAAPSNEKDNKQSIKVHPFLSSIHKVNKNSSSSFVHSPNVHPFLNQIKAAKGVGAVSKRISSNGVSTVTQNTSNTQSSSTSLTTTSTTTPTKLFSRFSFLNKGKRPDFLNSVKSNSTAKKKTGLKNIQTRLSKFKRPKLPSFHSRKKEDQEDVSNEIHVTEKTKSTESLFSHKKSSFLNRFNSKFKSSHAISSTSKSPTKVEKPRPKRLPSPFGNSRTESLFKPRPNRFFSHSILEKSSSTVSPDTTEKQTVGDIIAHLNGDDTEQEEDAVTIRPHNFKPKFGVSSKIREKLQAELAEVKVDESESISGPTSAKSEDRVAHREGLGLSRSRLISRSKLREEGGATRPTEPSHTALGPTVVTDVPQLTGLQTDGQDIVDIVHDGPTLTTNGVIPSTHSPFQVLLDSTNEDHEDHVHDLVHEHHPQIHLRHLQPDLQSDKSVFLPTMSSFEASTPASTAETVEVSSTAAPVSRSRSRSRSRYRQPASQAASRTAVAEQRRNRLQVRRRNRVQTERPDTEAAAPPASARTRESPRLRVRQRSRTRPASADRDQTEDKRTVDRVTNPRRLISRARNVGTQSRAPTFRARGGSRVRTSTQPATVVTELATEMSDFIDSVVEDDEQDELLEGKLTRVELDTATEGVTDGVVTVTTLTLNFNEENYEANQTTSPEVEPVTISPGKFKPKFGSDTRNKLRERLRQELLQNKTREEANLTHETELSDFSSGEREQGTATTSMVTLTDVNNEQQEDLYQSQIQSRRQRRLNEEDSPHFELVTLDRSHHSPGQLRVGRSTVVLTPTTSTKDVKPFLLRGGKGYLKDQKRFSAFRQGLPRQGGEKISGPNVDINSNIVTTDEDSEKTNYLREKKKTQNVFPQFGVKEVSPSVEVGSSDSVNVGITLDRDLGATQAPNSLTTSGLVSSLPKLNSSKSEITSGKYKNSFKLRKERTKTTIATTQSSQDSRIKNVKVDQKPLEPDLGSGFLLTASSDVPK